MYLDRTALGYSRTGDQASGSSPCSVTVLDFQRQVHLCRPQFRQAESGMSVTFRLPLRGMEKGRSWRYLHLDVFTDEPFTGNQLAVFLDAGDLDTELMQRIALEMAFSESTFVFPAEDPGTDLSGPAWRGAAGSSQPHDKSPGREDGPAQ